VTAIPVDGGWPIVGRMFEARRDVLAFLRGLESRHGSAVWTKGFFLRVLCLMGPDAAELVFKNKDEAFSSKRGWSMFIDHVFPGAIMSMDGMQHRVQRRIMQAAFTKRALRDYVERMSPRIGERIAQWNPGEMRVHPALKQLTLDVATSTFMGIGPGDDADRINQAFRDAVAASIAAVRLNVWPTPYWRGKRGRRYLVERFEALLPDKKKDALPDLFSQMCHAESEEGERFKNEEIVDHMIFVMMAAHDTSTSVLTTMSYLLAKHPQWQDRLREHSMSLDDDNLDYDALNTLDDMGWVMNEALRIYPPLAVIPRMAVKPVQFGEYVIPANSLVGLSPIFTHHMPTLWNDPERFDPERFSPTREEHKRHRFAFTPFGGGPHVCIGQHFAALEIKLVMHQLLRRYRWSVPADYELPYELLPIAKPGDGLPMSIEKL
jgi:cytochrome P450